MRDDTLENGGLAAVDLGAASVGTSEVVKGALGSADLGDASLGSAEIADGSLTGADVGDNSLGGADIDESSLGQVPSALLGGFGRTGAAVTCDPDTATFETCAATEVISVPPGARALVFGYADATTDFNDDFGVGRCRLGTSSIGPVPSTTVLFQVFDEVAEFDADTLVAITPPLPPGPTSFGIDCNQEAGQILYFETQASVVLIASN